MHPKTSSFMRIIAFLLILTKALAELESDSLGGENSITSLNAGVEMTSSVDGQDYIYFSYSHKGTNSFYVYLFPCTGNPDLFINDGKAGSTTLPSLHNHAYFSINGRGVDYVEIPSGVQDITIAVYGMTESHFSILVSLKPLEKLDIANRQVKVYSISSDRVSLMWLPASGRSLIDSDMATDSTMQGSTASLGREQRLDAAVSDYTVFSLLDSNVDESSKEGGVDSSLAFRPRETLLDTPCGMITFGTREGVGSLQTRQESQFMYLEVKNLVPGQEYTFNVLASGRRNGFFDAAYVPVRIKTEKFEEIKLDKEVSSFVEKGKYRHFKMAVKRPEAPLAERDNFFRDEELTMRFKLISADGGDADLYISLNVGPATFSTCDYSAEALSVDMIDIPITETYTTFYIGVYGKESSKFVLQTQLLKPSAVDTGSSASDDTSSESSSGWETFFQILGIILDILA